MDKKIIISSNLNNVKKSVDKILTLLKDLKAEDSDLFDVRLCLEESLINAIKYGNGLNEDLKVVIGVSHNNNKVTITVEDQGPGFDYQALPDPTKEENLLKPRGRGVFLIKHLMSNVEFNRKGNKISMTNGTVALNLFQGLYFNNLGWLITIFLKGSCPFRERHFNG